MNQIGFPITASLIIFVSIQKGSNDGIILFKHIEIPSCAPRIADSVSIIKATMQIVATVIKIFRFI
jgi:hypothetical protein